MANAHADASPSSASIWLKCPASVTKARGRKRLPTVYTAEGSAAHEVAERLIHGLPAPSEVTIDGFTFPVDDDMVEAVEVFCGYAGALKQKADIFRTETLVEVPTFGNEKLYGTADVIAYTKAIENIEIVDLKYGRGVAVSAANNPQLRIYALGAIDSLGGAYPISEVRMTIIQPRTGGEVGVNTEMVDVHELYAWRDTVLLPALAKIGLDDPTEKPGEHCRWCVRAGECRALADLAQSRAAVVFDDQTGTPDLKQVASLSDNELAAILDQADMVVSWIERVRAEASNRIDRGGLVPGWKLVAKRAMRKWVDEEDAMDRLSDEYPNVYDEMVVLDTPAGVERALKRHKIKPDIVATLVKKESSGTTLAPEEDPRPEVKNNPQTVFKQLTSSLEILG